MSSPIYDTTADYRAGLDFSYASWTADTEITLTNVPWNNDYRDIVKFPEGKTLDQYIAEQPSTRAPISNVNYAKPMQPVRLNIPFNVAYRYNYLRASLPAAPNMGDVKRTYYYFITDVAYVGPKVTQFNLQLDVWQTFGNEVEFGNSYIERGHIGMAHTKSFDNFGRDYLTSPEGLDVGGEYQTISRRSKKIFNKGTGNTFEDMMILVCSTVKLEDIPTDTSKPSVQTAGGDNIQGMPSGAAYYIFRSAGELQTFMRAYQSVPWVTQGIISITLIPNISRFGYNLTQVTGRLGVTMYRFSGDTGKGEYADLFPNWRDSTSLSEDIPERYRKLKKFFTYPYMAVEVTTWTGSPMILKPESWMDKNARLHFKPVFAPPNQRVMIFPFKYNVAPNQQVDTKTTNNRIEYYDDGGEYLDASTQVSNFPQLAIVNNMALSVLASNRNGINQQYAAADWSQQRAMAGIQNSFAQGQSSINTQSEQGRIARNQDILATGITNDQANLQMLSGAAGSIANSLTVPTPASAASSAIGIGKAALDRTISTQGMTNQLNNRNSASVQSQSAAVGNANFINDTNKSYAEFAAKGDYENTIAALNAKVQDIRMTQPSVSGQVGGEAFNIIHDAAEVSVRIKMIAPNEMAIVGEYWLRYGYSVRRFAILPKSLMVMAKFTYWKLAEAYLINTRIPESMKNTIRGIFEGGVTVWNNPDNIGNIDIADNDILPGVVLDNQPSTPPPPPIIPPVNPNPLDEKMYNINITTLQPNGFFSISTNFVKKLGNDTGIDVPQAVAGQLIPLDRLGGEAVFKQFGIPLKYMDEAVLYAEYPDGWWSLDRENEAKANLRDNDIKTLLAAINEKIEGDGSGEVVEP